MQIQNTAQNQNPSIFAADTSGSTTSSTATTGSATDPTSLATEDTFLQLMVAQLKNQDPTEPTDSTQFLTQLAQFSQLEQLINIRTELDPTQTAASSTGNNNAANASTGAPAL